MLSFMNSRAAFLTLARAYDSPGDLVKPQILSPYVCRGAQGNPPRMPLLRFRGPPRASRKCWLTGSDRLESFEND